VVLGVTALTAGGIWLYKNWDRIPGLFSDAWDKVKSFVMFWKDEDLQDKTPGVDTGDIEEAKKSLANTGMDMPMQPHLTEPITIPDQKIIDIIFNYPDPLKIPDSIQAMSAPEKALPDNVVGVDFSSKIRSANVGFDSIPDLNYQKYQEIPGSNDVKADNSGEKNFQDHRKIIIQKLIVNTNGETDEKKLSMLIREQLKEIVDQNWGDSLYDQAEVG
jgi:hypothetical protein